MKITKPYLHNVILGLGLFSTLTPQLSTAFAQGTAFTYQGRLSDGTGPATGLYDLRFTIYDAGGGGSLVAEPLITAPVAVSNGLFTVTLDFGAGVFTGPSRWLEIGVRTNGSVSTHTPLVPRQPLTASPYAVYAGSAGTVGAVSWNSISGVPVTVMSNTLGSVGDQPLELKVNGQRALRLEPNTNGAPNVIGGSSLNQADAGVVGATISGGGANLIQSNGAFSAIAGGYLNVIENNTFYSFIAGGYGNDIQAGVVHSSIGGGTINTNGSPYSVIAGGQNNTIEPGSDLSAIGGGWLNLIRSGADQSVIAGGNANHVLSGARESFVGGGFANNIQSNAYNAFIGGGAYNSISPGGAVAFIGGGIINTNASAYSTIGGGYNNGIGANSPDTTVGGGAVNSIASGSGNGTIGGGIGNRIGDSSPYSTVAGGFGNSVSYPAQAGAIGGGLGNAVAGEFATVSGGRWNTSSWSYATVGGGYQNRASGNFNGFGDSATVAGGYQNMALGNNAFVGGGFANYARGDNSTIAGGWLHTNQTGFGTIGGGQQNLLELFARFSVIGGGDNNSVRSNSSYTVISGGQSNRIGTNASYATIPGGFSNEVTATHGFAAGRRAKANHPGAFVWADSADANFSSTATNQFSVRASGGVRLETGGAGVSVDGLGVLAGSVNASQIADGAVTTAKITDGTIAPADLNLTAFNPTFWRTTGNAGTTPDTQFVGTTDTQPLTLKVNGATALRIDPTDSAPNIVGGLAAFRPTVIGTNVRGAVVAGGNAPAGPVNGLGAGDYHAVFDSDGAIGGGFGNKVGTDNNDPNDAPFATVAGGVFNGAASYAATVAGGDANFAGGFRSTVVGGAGNWALGQDTFVGGGANNRAHSGHSTVGGGQNNIATNAHSTVAGGGWNIASGISSFIGGGGGNTFGGPRTNIASGTWSAILGGWNNTASGESSAIGGGAGNVAAGTFATIPGGEQNRASGIYSFAAGQSANAAHAGAFVWADSQFGSFASTANNQFLIRASGGVGIGTGTPSGRLTVQTSDDTAANVVAAFDQRHTVMGSPTEGVAISYSSTDGRGYISSLSPNVAWRDLVLQASRLEFRPSGGGPTFVVQNNGSLSFGSQTRQMLNLWSTNYGIGVQSSAAYFRTDQEFMWYRRGSHSDTFGDPGAGGSQLMRLGSAGDLIIAGTLSQGSDRNIKQGFTPLDVQEVLRKVTTLPIQSWAYTNDPSCRHVGPIAQDFHAAFGLNGNDDKHIAVVDESGVALAAIQGLNEKVEVRSQKAEVSIQELRAENAELKQQLNEIKTVLRELAEKRKYQP